MELVKIIRGELTEQYDSEGNRMAESDRSRKCWRPQKYFHKFSHNKSNCCFVSNIFNSGLKATKRDTTLANSTHLLNSSWTWRRFSASLRHTPADTLVLLLCLIISQCQGCVQNKPLSLQGSGQRRCCCRSTFLPTSPSPVHLSDVPVRFFFFGLFLFFL